MPGIVGLPPAAGPARRVLLPSDASTLAYDHGGGKPAERIHCSKQLPKHLFVTGGPHVLRDALPYLVCPHCAAAFTEAAGSLVCSNGHAFDIARQGYVSLLAAHARTDTADTQAMVDARAIFLDQGHYATIASALAEETRRGLEAAGQPEGCVVDCGAGTGYYLAHLLDALPDRVGVAVDVSKSALRRAARSHRRAAAVAADVWDALPIATGGAAAVVDVFAPRNPQEFARVLNSAGLLLVVTPTSDHLTELVERLGLLRVDERKQERLDLAMQTAFSRRSARDVSYTTALGHAEVVTVVGMGPSAWHRDPDAVASGVSGLPDPLEVTISVRISSYGKE